jgi:hypothetical protein
MVSIKNWIRLLLKSFTNTISSFIIIISSKNGLILQQAIRVDPTIEDVALLYDSDWCHPDIKVMVRLT